MPAYQGSWAAIFAAEATRQAREDLCPSSAPITAEAIAELIAREMEDTLHDR